MTTASSIAGFVIAAVGLAELASAVWVYRDAKDREEAGRPVSRSVLSLGASRYGTPVTWLWGCLLVWPVFFPFYLWVRRATKDTGGTIGSTPDSATMPRGLSPESSVRLRVWAYRASGAVVALAVIGVVFAGNLLRGPSLAICAIALIFVVAPALALVGAFAPQLQSRWQNRHQAR